MKKKDPIKISLPIFITVIVILVACVSGILMYMQNQKLDKEIANLKEDISKTQEEKNELQVEKNELLEKLNTASNIAIATEKGVKESSNSEEQEKKTSSNIELNYGEYYDLLSAIKEDIINGGNDMVSGQVIFNNNEKVSIALDVVDSVNGTYTITGDTIICKMTSISSEGENEKKCNYTVKYKLLHNRGLEVLSSDLKDGDKNVYSNGDMLICYR